MTSAIAGGSATHWVNAPAGVRSDGLGMETPRYRWELKSAAADSP
jgi:hypothetical protein